MEADHLSGRKQLTSLSFPPLYCELLSHRGALTLDLKYAVT